MSPCELLSSSCGSGGGDCDRRRERGAHSSLSAASNVLEGVRPPIELLAGLHARDGSRLRRREKRREKRHKKRREKRREKGIRGQMTPRPRGVKGGSRAHRWPIGPHKIVAGAEAAYSKVVLVLGMSSIDLLRKASTALRVPRRKHGPTIRAGRAGCARAACGARRDA